MKSHHPEADQIVRRYIGAAAAPAPLGWGLDGVVYPHPTAHTAIKIHRGQDGFGNELAAYLRLTEHGVSQLQAGGHQFNVPVLVHYDTADRLIEMSIVRPPFLLDFAGATIDDPSDFTAEALGEWWDQVASDFADDFPIARDVFWILVRKYGIYYWDLKPRNLCFR
jgi:hypothetical protein